MLSLPVSVCGKVLVADVRGNGLSIDIGFSVCAVASSGVVWPHSQAATQCSTDPSANGDQLVCGGQGNAVGSTAAW